MKVQSRLKSIRSKAYSAFEAELIVEAHDLDKGITRLCKAINGLKRAIFWLVLTKLVSDADFSLIVNFHFPIT